MFTKMSETITTLSNILLQKKGKKYVPNSPEFFVNGQRVKKWTYARTEGDFYTETIVIYGDLGNTGINISRKRPSEGYIGLWGDIYIGAGEVEYYVNGHKVCYWSFKPIIPDALYGELTIHDMALVLPPK